MLPICVQIEDDVIATPNYFQQIRNFIEEHAVTSWATLEFCPHGFIGKLIKNADLLKLVTLLRVFYLEMPCDFLIGHFNQLMLQKKVKTLCS